MTEIEALEIICKATYPDSDEEGKALNKLESMLDRMKREQFERERHHDALEKKVCKECGAPASTLYCSMECLHADKTSPDPNILLRDM